MSSNSGVPLAIYNHQIELNRSEKLKKQNKRNLVILYNKIALTEGLISEAYAHLERLSEEDLHILTDQVKYKNVLKEKLRKKTNLVGRSLLEAHRDNKIQRAVQKELTRRNNQQSSSDYKSKNSKKVHLQEEGEKGRDQNTQRLSSNMDEIKLLISIVFIIFEVYFIGLFTAVKNLEINVL